MKICNKGSNNINYTRKQNNQRGGVGFDIAYVVGTVAVVGMRARLEWQRRQLREREERRRQKYNELMEEYEDTHRLERMKIVSKLMKEWEKEEDKKQKEKRKQFWKKIRRFRRRSTKSRSTKSRSTKSRSTKSRSSSL